MTLQSIEVKKLAHSTRNARRTNTGKAIDELKASILSHGLMQNLVVTDAGGGRFRVIAGGRRLEALRQLQDEGKLPADHAVNCQIVGDDRAAELSLAENTVRQAMHPADEFEAFAGLIDAGESASDIAGRFGVTARHVEQRLKLGRIVPELLAEYRADNLTLDALMAFAITDDHAKQLEIYRGLQPWQVDDASAIRSLLTGEMEEASCKLARFVGLDAYHAAGGASRSDLFGDSVYLEDTELLNRLAADKLEAVRKELEAEGWGWIEISPERDYNFTYRCRRIRPEPVDVPQALLDRQAEIEIELQALEDALGDDEDSDAYDRAIEQLEEVEDQIAAFATFDPQQMAHAGCYVSIDSDGALSIEKGLVRREDAKRLFADGVRRVKAKGDIPESLRRDLAAYRQQAAQVELATNRLAALDLLVFTAARGVLGHPASKPLDVTFNEQRPGVKEATEAAVLLETIRDTLPASWLDHETEAEQFQAFTALSDTQKLDLLAYCVAMTLKPQLATEHEDTAWEIALAITQADMARYWRPTRANYLGRITRDRLLAIGRELFGEQWSQARSRDKKGEIADALERAFAAPQTLACPREQRERLARWLPEGMAFGTTAADKPTPAATASKAA
jgi:ParB family chromosome partitioning protein